MLKTAEVDVELLTDLLNNNRNWNKICDMFKIPHDQRGETYVATQILERVKTYLSGYIGRRSMEERENGAAFELPVQQIPPDPSFEGFADEPKN